MPSRIEQEKQTVERMVRLYCRKKEGNKQLCPRCEELLGYARIRLSRCPFGENKSTCRQCSIHCYKPEMKERMRAVCRTTDAVIPSRGGTLPFVAGVCPSVFHQTFRSPAPGTAQTINRILVVSLQRGGAVLRYNLTFVRDVDRQALTLSVHHKKCPHLALGAHHFAHNQLK